MFVTPVRAIGPLSMYIGFFVKLSHLTVTNFKKIRYTRIKGRLENDRLTSMYIGFSGKMSHSFLKFLATNLGKIRYTRSRGK